MKRFQRFDLTAIANTEEPDQEAYVQAAEHNPDEGDERHDDPVGKRFHGPEVNVCICSVADFLFWCVGRVYVFIFSPAV